MDKIGKILNLMKDYKPQTLKEIEAVIRSRRSSNADVRRFKWGAHFNIDGY